MFFDNNNNCFCGQWIYITSCFTPGMSNVLITLNRLVNHRMIFDQFLRRIGRLDMKKWKLCIFSFNIKQLHSVYTGKTLAIPNLFLLRGLHIFAMFCCFLNGIKYFLNYRKYQKAELKNDKWLFDLVFWADFTAKLSYINLNNSVKTNASLRYVQFDPINSSYNNNWQRWFWSIS